MDIGSWKKKIPHTDGMMRPAVLKIEHSTIVPLCMARALHSVPPARHRPEVREIKIMVRSTFPLSIMR